MARIFFVSHRILSWGSRRVHRKAVVKRKFGWRKKNVSRSATDAPVGHGLPNQRRGRAWLESSAHCYLRKQERNPSGIALNLPFTFYSELKMPPFDFFFRCLAIANFTIRLAIKKEKGARIIHYGSHEVIYGLTASGSRFIQYVGGSNRVFMVWLVWNSLAPTDIISEADWERTPISSPITSHELGTQNQQVAHHTLPKKLCNFLARLSTGFFSFFLSIILISFVSSPFLSLRVFFSCRDNSSRYKLL